MTDCGSEAKTDSPAQRPSSLDSLWDLNATMFVAGMVAGLIGQSSGLIADSLDMFADAVGYGIALSAFNRGTAF
jgi:Co/Zn/Cd efflux system component